MRGMQMSILDLVTIVRVLSSPVASMHRPPLHLEISEAIYHVSGTMQARVSVTAATCNMNERV